MKITNIFTKFAKSETGQKFYKNILHPSKENFLNNHLPILESATVTGFYCLATSVQKDIPEENKKSLQIQNILSFLISTAICVPLNKKASKFGAEISKHIKPELMEDSHKVINGLLVGLPMLSTLLINRFAVAVGLVPLSTKIRDRMNKNNKIDIKA